MRKLGRWGAIIAVAVLCVWFLTPVEERVQTTAVVILMMTFALLSAAPRVRAALRGKAGVIQAAGILVGGLAVGVIFAPSIWPIIRLSDGQASTIAVMGTVIAVLAIVLARQIRADAVQDANAPSSGSPHPPRPRGFAPMAESVDALRFVFSNPRAFVRIVGPWLAALLLLPVPIIAFSDFAQHQARSHPYLMLSFVMANLACMAVTVPMAAIGWVRFVAGEPAVRSPTAGIVWAYLWRMVVGLSMLGSVRGLFEPKAAELGAALGGMGGEIVKGLGVFLGYVFFLMIAAMLALALPAIALGERGGFDLYRQRMGRLGRTYPLGFGVVILPFIGAQWLIFQALNLSRTKVDGPGGAALLCFVGLLWFLALAAAMTYLTRAYQFIREADFVPSTSSLPTDSQASL